MRKDYQSDLTLCLNYCVLIIKFPPAQKTYFFQNSLFFFMFTYVWFWILKVKSFSIKTLAEIIRPNRNTAFPNFCWFAICIHPHVPNFSKKFFQCKVGLLNMSFFRKCWRIVISSNTWTFLFSWTWKIEFLWDLRVC